MVINEQIKINPYFPLYTINYPFIIAFYLNKQVNSANITTHYMQN